MAETVTLECHPIAPDVRRITSMRDDIKVLTAIVLRRKETLIRMLEQMTAMVAQNSRIVDRLRAVDEWVSWLEELEQ